MVASALNAPGSNEEPPVFPINPAWPIVPVERIVDGDTIIVHVHGKRHRLRYVGIDTPESVDPERMECYGPEASAANARLVEGEHVALEYDVEERDDFGRLLAYVYRLDGLFVNAYLVQQGYARVGWYPPNFKHRELLLQLEHSARQVLRGMWGACP